jgi:hypothetical protein
LPPSTSADSNVPYESIFRATMKQTDTSILSIAQKGTLAEGRTRLTMLRAGYEELPAKLPGNKGFDGVWIKQGPGGIISDIIITESKFSSTGTMHLTTTKTMGQQLSNRWIDANLEQMVRSNNPAVQESANLLYQNKFMIRTKTAVLDPSGILRFHEQ